MGSAEQGSCPANGDSQVCEAPQVGPVSRQGPSNVVRVEVHLLDCRECAPRGREIPGELVALEVYELQVCELAPGVWQEPGEAVPVHRPAHGSIITNLKNAGFAKSRHA
eukprot:scaffold172374_cov20-Prasinocladus_malaysianus.AAC.2